MEKILIVAPRDKVGIVSCYPFFYKLNELYPEAQINIIVAQGLASYCNFLSFKVYVYELPDDKNTFFGIHHFCVNLHDVFNIDLSFDLVSDFKSSFLAFSFRSKKRYGYITGWNKLFLNEKLEKTPHRDLSVRGLELLNKLEPELELSTFEMGPEIVEPIIKEETEGAEVIPLFKKEKNQFIFVVIKELLGESKDLWIEFFNLFESQKFIFIQDKDINLKKDFIPLLSEKNEYFIQPETGPEVVTELIEKSHTFLTNEYWFYLMASSRKKLGFYFTDRPQEVTPLCYLRSGNKVIEMDKASMIKIDNGLGEKKDIRVTDEVLDFIHETVGL